MGTINYVGEFIAAGQALEVKVKDRWTLNNAYEHLAKDVAKDIVNLCLTDCLEDLLIIDTEGYSYTLDEGEIERLLVNGIADALMQMAGR